MTERTLSESGRAWLTGLAVGLVVVGAAALRLWGLAGGLPASLGVDEPQVMVRALAIVRAGNLNPHFFDYPSLYIYLQAGVIVVRFLAGASAGAWSSLAQVTDYDFYLWGRALTAALGTATVFLVYLAGKRWGTREALLAAAALAVMPVHVRESHFVLTDVPMTFFVTLALVLSLRAHESGSPRAFAWAGAAAGLAAATKYTAWVSVLLPIVAAVALAGAPPVRMRRAFAAAVAFGGAFLLAAPYTVLDLPAFLNGFAGLAAGVPLRAASSDSGLHLYLKHLRNALGWPGYVAAAAGLVLFIVRAVRGPGRAVVAMMLVFLGVFWLMIIDRRLIFARYLMPAIPIVCLMIAAATVLALDWLRHFAVPRAVRVGVATALTLAILVPPALSSASFDRESGRQWTYSLAMDWITANLPPGSHIVHEVAALHFPPMRFHLEHTSSLTDRSVESYLSGDAHYVIATSAAYGKFMDDPAHYQARYAAYLDLFKRLELVYSVQPSAEHPGPEVRVYKVPR